MRGYEVTDFLFLKFSVKVSEKQKVKISNKWKLVFGIFYWKYDDSKARRPDLNFARRYEPFPFKLARLRLYFFDVSSYFMKKKLSKL